MWAYLAASGPVNECARTMNGPFSFWSKTASIGSAGAGMSGALRSSGISGRVSPVWKTLGSLDRFGFAAAGRPKMFREPAGGGSNDFGGSLDFLRKIWAEAGRQRPRVMAAQASRVFMASPPWDGRRGRGRASIRTEPSDAQGWFKGCGRGGASPGLRGRDFNLGPASCPERSRGGGNPRDSTTKPRRAQRKHKEMQGFPPVVFLSCPSWLRGEPGRLFRLPDAASCNSMSRSMPEVARSSISSSAERSKTPPSPVPWTSTNPSGPSLTTFRSTSARESSE